MLVSRPTQAPDALKSDHDDDVLASSPPSALSPAAALFLDFDGTLVELAAAPSQINVAPDLTAILGRVAARLGGALAIVTGRPIGAIDGFLSHAVECVVGLHGAEFRDSQQHIIHPTIDLTAIRRGKSLLKDFAQHHPRVVFEDKGASAALHFRAAPELADICREAVDKCVALAAGTVERLDGHCIVELKSVNVSKGAAMLSLMRTAPFAGRTPIFVGDDLTDETGFIAASHQNGLGIIVGDRQPTAAKNRFPSVTAVLQWLREFSNR